VPRCCAAQIRLIGTDFGQERLGEHLDNPFLAIDDALARRCDGAAGHRPGRMDEQPVEDGPLGMAFPEDMREIMTLYSELDTDGRRSVLTTLRALAGAFGGGGREQGVQNLKKKLWLDSHAAALRGSVFP